MVFYILDIAVARNDVEGLKVSHFRVSVYNLVLLLSYVKYLFATEDPDGRVWYGVARLVQCSIARTKYNLDCLYSLGLKTLIFEL